MSNTPKYQTGARILEDGRKYVNYNKGESSINFLGDGDRGTVKANVASPVYKGFSSTVNASKEFANRDVNDARDKNKSYDVGAGLRYNSSGGIDFGANVSGDTDKNTDAYNIGTNIGITKRNISANAIAKAQFDKDKKDYEMRSAVRYNPQIKRGQLDLNASLNNIFNNNGDKEYGLNTGVNFRSNNGFTARGGYNRQSSPYINSSNASIGGSYTYSNPKFRASLSADKVFSSNKVGDGDAINSKSSTGSGSFNANLSKGLNIKASAGFNSNNNAKNINSFLGAGVGYNRVSNRTGRPSWGTNIEGNIESSYAKRPDGTYAKTALPRLSGSVYKNVGKNTNISLGKSFNKLDKENNRAITLGITSRF